MTSAAPGIATLAAEVSHISKFGVWLLLANEELFLSYEDFPWFRDAPLGKVLDLEWPSPDHLYWPGLDVDLSVESIRHPERFPLKAAG
jgi:hypothetical protein